MVVFAGSLGHAQSWHGEMGMVAPFTNQEHMVEVREEEQGSG